MKVLFRCPECDAPGGISLDRDADWRCSACPHHQHFAASAADLHACAVCGSHELYKQKDFPHRLGLIVLIVAFVASVFTYGWYEKWLTWAILIGTAIFDGALYCWVGDALVCYRCHAHHKGFPALAEHLPFEITVGERYRQQRIREERS